MKSICSGFVPGVAALLVLGLSARDATAQDFDALWSKARSMKAQATEDPAAQRLAFRAAFDAFAKLDAESDAYRAALPRGAEAALRGGRNRDAAVLFGELWERAPDDRALAMMLTALVRVGQAHAAATLAREHYAKYPGGVHDWLRSDFSLGRFGGTWLRSGDQLGLWLLETQVKSLRGRNGQEIALGNLALLYRLSGKFDAAQRAYREALKIAPRDAILWNDYGLLLKGAGRHQEAFAAYVKGLAVEKEPGRSPSGTNLGVLAQRTGKNRGRDPLADLVVVLRLRPEPAFTRRLLLDRLVMRKARPSSRGGSRKSR